MSRWCWLMIFHSNPPNKPRIRVLTLVFRRPGKGSATHAALWFVLAFITRLMQVEVEAVTEEKTSVEAWWMMAITNAMMEPRAKQVSSWHISVRFIEALDSPYKELSCS